MFVFFVSHTSPTGQADSSPRRNFFLSHHLHNTLACPCRRDVLPRAWGTSRAEPLHNLPTSVVHRPHGRQGAPGAPVRMRPLQNMEVTSHGGHGDRPRRPGAPMQPRPLQDLEVAVHRGARTRPRAPRVCPCTQPLERGQVPTHGRLRTRSPIHGATLGVRPTQYRD